MKRRALTDEQKREMLDRLYALWTTNDEIRAQRLGQLISNGLVIPGGGSCRDLFNIEDQNLVDLVAAFTEKHRK